MTASTWMGKLEPKLHAEYGCVFLSASLFCLCLPFLTEFMWLVPHFRVPPHCSSALLRQLSFSFAVKLKNRLLSVSWHTPHKLIIWQRHSFSCGPTDRQMDNDSLKPPPPHPSTFCSCHLFYYYENFTSDGEAYVPVSTQVFKFRAH